VEWSVSHIVGCVVADAEPHAQAPRGSCAQCIGRQTVKETITSYVGLDIHKDSIAIAVADASRAAPRFIGTINPAPSELCKVLRRERCRPESTLLAYEAGPCGYGWVRYLRGRKWACEVIAPSRLTRSPAEQRVKTDRRDALLLARELRSGNLTSIVVPDERDEAIRDLARAREDAVAARLRTRLQMKAMLLRHGRDYVRFRSWSQAHERHLSTIRFDHPAQEIAFNEYRLACREAAERVERITAALREMSESWRMQPLVKALMCLRGLDFVAAVTFVAEIGDLSRFEHPRALMSYLGLVPSEYSSGASRRQGAITKCGNKHARRILVESAWSNHFKAQISRVLQVRQEGQPKIIREISWKAQLRLSKRWRSLAMGRKLNHNKICIAIARELAGFIWDVGRHVTLRS
jgi:transposase